VPPLETLMPDGLMVNDQFARSPEAGAGPEEMAPLGGFEATSLDPSADAELGEVTSVDFEAGQVAGLQGPPELDQPAQPPPGFDATAESDIDLSGVLPESLSDESLEPASPGEPDAVVLDFIEAAPEDIGLGEAPPSEAEPAVPAV